MVVDATLLLVLWVWTMSAVLSALIEHERRGTFPSGFFVGLILGPLGVLVSLFIPRKQPPSTADWQNPAERPPQCPECKAPISPASRFCEQCGASLRA